jgi:predicted nucleic acid-binding Zn ribbon protein
VILVARLCWDCAELYITRECGPFRYEYVICPTCRGVRRPHVEETPRVRPSHEKPREGRLCVRCSEPIPAKRSGKAMFCSYECRWRSWYEAQQAKVPTLTKVCALDECGKSFETRDDRKKFCTIACATVAYNAGLRAATRARRGTRTCVWCDDPIPARRPQGTKYCSPRCRTRAVRARARLTLHKACAYCNQPFETRASRKRFCSERCQVRDEIARRNAKRTAAVRARLGDDKPCDLCGRPFTPRDMKQRFCSKRCGRLVWESRRISVLIEPRARRSA